MAWKILFCATFVVSLATSSEAALIAFDSVTTTVVEGTPESVGGFTNGPTHTFHNDQTIVTSLSAGSTQYNPVLGFDRMSFTLKANPNPTRVFYERGGTALSGDSLSFTGSPLADLYDMFDTPLVINYGSDDTFVKSLDSIRFWSSTSISPTSNDGLTRAGVSIIERGANDNNFRVRAITSLNGGNPDGVTDWLLIGGGDPFGNGVRNLNHALYDSETTNGIGPFTQASVSEQNRNQQIGALLIPFADFGLSIGDRIYGYEIAVNTSGSRTGLDLLSGATSLVENGVTGFEFIGPMTSQTPELPFANVLMGVGFGFVGWYRRSRKSKQSSDALASRQI
ncbi:hypothetical protein [Thalassoglobus sp.]|uniref:hypothetical protein n=1 Tax=Thalassoglobus sp. TaxID=2795869 RepID=UPI003AA7AC70